MDNYSTLILIVQALIIFYSTGYILLQKKKLKSQFITLKNIQVSQTDLLTENKNLESEIVKKSDSFFREGFLNLAGHIWAINEVSQYRIKLAEKIALSLSGYYMITEKQFPVLFRVKNYKGETRDYSWREGMNCINNLLTAPAWDINKIFDKTNDSSFINYQPFTIEFTISSIQEPIQVMHEKEVI